MSSSFERFVVFFFLFLNRHSELLFLRKSLGVETTCISSSVRVGQWRPVKCLPATQKSFQFPTTALLDNYYWLVLCCAKLAGQQLWSYFFDVNSSPRQLELERNCWQSFRRRVFQRARDNTKKKLLQSQSRTLLCFCNLSLVSSD